jgi:hypothetical protein
MADNLRNSLGAADASARYGRPHDPQDKPQAMRFLLCCCTDKREIGGFETSVDVRRSGAQAERRKTNIDIPRSRIGGPRSKLAHKSGKVLWRFLVIIHALGVRLQSEVIFLSVLIGSAVAASGR